MTAVVVQAVGECGSGWEIDKLVCVQTSARSIPDVDLFYNRCINLWNEIQGISSKFLFARDSEYRP